MEDSKTVLIVDDEPYIVKSLGFVLRRAGYRVLEARTGRDALETIENERPSLVFLDIMIPHLDGFEVCRRIKSSEALADTHVIMLTAKGQEGDRTRGIEAGADEYMTKPFSPSGAVDRARAVLGES